MMAPGAPPDQTGVPLTVPLRFITAGVGSFLALNLWFTWFLPDIAGTFLRNPNALVATHLFTLGWGAMVIMGALYQLLPVILLARLHSIKLARFGWWSFVLGLLGLLSGFLGAGASSVIAGGTLLVTGLGCFLYNQIRTMLNARQWHITGTYLAASFVYLAAVATWGLLLALNWRLGFFERHLFDHILAHVTLGMAGWFTVTIIGVAYRLIPMFTLSHRQLDWVSKAVFALLNAGVTGLVLGAVLGLGRPVLALFAALIVGAVLLFIWDVYRILKARHRKSLDVSVRYTLTAFVNLLLTGALLLGAWAGLWPGLLSRPAGAVGLVYLGGMGWVSLMIVGQMYKILPFLVWTDRYAAVAGARKVPTLREMFDARLAEGAYWPLVAGVLLVPAGLLFDVIWVAVTGSALATVGALGFAVGIWQIVKE